MRRPLLAISAVVAGVYTATWAGHTTATAACTADPPQVEVPDGSRVVDLQLDGWDCVIVDGDNEVARVGLGWWPRDGQTAWARFEPSAEHTVEDRDDAPAPNPSPTSEATPIDVTVTARTAADLTEIAPTVRRPYGELLTVDENRNVGPQTCVRGPDGWWVLDGGSASLVHLDADDAAMDLRVPIPTDLLVHGKYVQWYDMVVTARGTVAAIRAGLDSEGGGTSVLLHDSRTGELTATHVGTSMAASLWATGDDVVLAGDDRVTLLDSATGAARPGAPHPLRSLPRLTDGTLRLETLDGAAVTITTDGNDGPMPIVGASYAANGPDLWILLTARDPGGFLHALVTVGSDGTLTDGTGGLPAAVAGPLSPVSSAPALHHHSGVVSLCGFLPDGVAMWDLPTP